MANFDLKMDLSEIRVEDIATWPKVVRIVFISVTCVALMVIIYFIDNQRQTTVLNRERHAESKLRETFEVKQRQAANVQAYREQLAQIKRNLGNLLTQLPNQTEVPGLLEDISALGHANGLKFTLFKPLPETQHEFYAKLPIQIAIQGNYHQVAEFVSDVSELDRIVTLDDFTLTQVMKPKHLQTGDNKVEESNRLSIDLTAHTYRYIHKVAS